MPLTFDMSMDALKQYKGINPKPADFDAFWDDSLAEMHALDPKVELKKAAFQVPFAECFDMFFTGVANARVHAKLVRPPKAEKPRPGMLIFHGYSGRAPDWSGLLHWSAMGYTVAALDCRGQAGQSEDAGPVVGNTLRGHIIRGLSDSPKKLLFRSIFLDTAQMARIVMGMPGVDPDRVGATGGSQGGGLTLACAALEPRVKRAAPLYPFLCDYKRVWQMDQDKDAYDELRAYFRLFDPRHQREDEIFTRLGYIDVQHLAPRIRAEILMGVGLRDTICPPSTQFAAYNKITSAKSLAVYPDFGHEGLPGMEDSIIQFMAGL